MSPEAKRDKVAKIVVGTWLCTHQQLLGVIFIKARVPAYVCRQCAKWAPLLKNVVKSQNKLRERNELKNELGMSGH
jgi:hypothetical protein